MRDVVIASYVRSAQSRCRPNDPGRDWLFDLQADPDEFHDLAKGDAHSAEIDRLYGCLAQWGRRLAQRVQQERLAVSPSISVPTTSRLITA